MLSLRLAMPHRIISLTAPLLLGGSVGLSLPAVSPAPAGANGMAGMVKAICLGAFQSEIDGAGKVAPAGMADFACGCVTERISNGTSLDEARSTCKQLTAQRYPLRGGRP
jgi:hypothetical protein